MNANHLVEPILTNLKEAIRSWNPPAAEDDGQKVLETLTDRIKLAAQNLEVSDKTIWNWLNSPTDHPIPLRKLCQICYLLGINPNTLFPGCPQTETIETISNPVAAEQTLLDIEQEISGGGLRRVCFPLFSSVLFKERLVEVYATKGMHHGYFSTGGKSFLGEGDRKEQFLKLRGKRRNLFKDGNYVLRVVFMRDEFEKFVNGERLFKHCEAPDRISQIEYIKDLLKTKVRDSRPRLEMRLTKSHFRTQYAINTRPDGSDVLILNTNSGYAKVKNLGMEECLKKEFEIIWEDATYKGLRTAEEWVAFLDKLTKEIERRHNLASSFSEENRRGEEVDRRRIDLKAIMEGRATL